ncbi:MAG: 3-deoxy-7-phosphoheptulonate synthase [Lachnospiraceae bacterium]|nr:3-deoxy-7-phosphoheptulonate synthase [Lachnospiraceae bacterium]MBR2752604.1 3-deoxy-7-phosphoheptulonate synthase [Lachnospiraceae bacterium]
MICILKPGVTKDKQEQLIKWLKSQNLGVHISEGETHCVLGLIGDTSKVDGDLLESLEIVEAVRRVSEPYKTCSRQFHPDKSVIDVSGVRVGEGLTVIAGPCSVESEEQIITVAKEIKKAGADILRGGAFKPRTSPYSFQGLKGEGLKLLSLAKKETGLPIVTELMDIDHIDLFDDVDIIQIGARNMQNYELLKELGHVDKPILLKRGLANTIEELLMSAEYIMAGGNERVILCERGIRTFERATRNTLDLSIIPVLREKTHLPIIIDPSHATGKANLVPPMALAAVAAGTDGVMVEVHNDPLHALCDGAQSLKPEQFADLARRMMIIREVVS